MKKLIFPIGAFVILLSLIFWANKMPETYPEKITITAYYMQYACGDDVDDMQVKTVSNKKFKFLKGKDIDPMIGMWDNRFGKFELKDYFYDNYSKNYGLEFKLTGYLAKSGKVGCDKNARCFIIKEISLPDGSAKMTSQDF